MQNIKAGVSVIVSNVSGILKDFTGPSSDGAKADTEMGFSESALGPCFMFGYARMYVVSIASLKEGMNHFVLVVHRNVVATAAMVPFALWLESFSSALYNIPPASTFILAVILRMEKVKIKSLRGQAKVVGTIITVAGALVMIVHKGPVVKLIWSKGKSHQDAVENHNHSHFIAGTFMSLTSCSCWALFFIIQASTLKEYPAELTLTTLIRTLGVIESGVVAAVMARSIAPWIIGFDTRLFTIVYSV